MAACTELSRTQSKKLLSKGQVTVDGQLVKDSSFKVTENEIVQIQGKRIFLVGTRYLMLNKPAETVCTSINDDSRSVMGLLDISKPELLHIAGRLDIDTTGLVLITDDGAWSHRITSPKKVCGKRYRVGLAEPIKESAALQLKQGIQLKGEAKLTQPAILEIITPKEVILTIHEGKYHQVKRMFAALSNRVVSLHREQVGAICLDKNLEQGAWRFLTEAEINSAN